MLDFYSQIVLTNNITSIRSCRIEIIYEWIKNCKNTPQNYELKIYISVSSDQSENRKGLLKLEVFAFPDKRVRPLFTSA